MDIFEGGDTIELKWSADVEPAAAPEVSVFDVASTLVASGTSVQSDTTHYYYPFTCPRTPGYFVAEWLAQKTFNASLRNFVDRFAFRVGQTPAI